MATKKVLILVRNNMKEEVPNLGIDHAMGAMAVFLEDVEFQATVAFVNSGVLNCIKGQKFLDVYGVEGVENVIKLALASDVRIVACKEDLEKYGISEDMLTDAKELGVETGIEVLPWEKINEEINQADYVLLF